MADTRDPNKIAKPGTPTPAWITPDGKYITTNKAEAQKNGATHQVTASVVTYADGRRQYVVFTGDDRSLEPGTFSPAGSELAKDPDVSGEWERAGQAVQRETAASERKKISVTYEGTGADRKRRTVYEAGPDLVEDAPETSATSPTAQRTAREEAEIERNRNLPPDQDPYPETDADRRARAERVIKEQGLAATAAANASRPQVVSTNTTEPYIVTSVNGELMTTPNPNYKGPEQKPLERSTVKGADGRTYVVTLDKDGNASAAPVAGLPAEQVKPEKSEIRDIDGVPHEIIRDPATGQIKERRPLDSNPAGAGTGPSMPELVVGMTADALRKYDAANRREVAAGRMTESQRQRRLQEALQLANVGAAEARQVSADNQSNMAASINLATTKYQGMMGGMNNALDFVSKFIGKLPEGSDLGGKGFAAILGMQALFMHRSGLNDIKVPGQRTPGGGTASVADTRPPMELTNPNDPAAVEAQRQQVMAELQTATAPPPEAATGADAGPPPPDPALTAPGGPAAPSEPIFRPQPPVGAMAAAATPASAPATAPGVTRDPNDLVTIRSTSDPTSTLRVPRFMVGTNPGQYRPEHYTLDDAPAPSTPSVPPVVTPAPVVPTPAVTQTDPLAMGPQGGMTQQQPAVPDYAVLAQQMQPPQQPVQPIDFGEPPVLLHSRAASTPPWRMQPEEIEAYQAAGVPDDVIFSTPRWGAA